MCPAQSCLGMQTAQRPVTCATMKERAHCSGWVMDCFIAGTVFRRCHRWVWVGSGLLVPLPDGVIAGQQRGCWSLAEWQKHRMAEAQYGRIAEAQNGRILEGVIAGQQRGCWSVAGAQAGSQSDKLHHHHHHHHHHLHRATLPVRACACCQEACTPLFTLHALTAYV